MCILELREDILSSKEGEIVTPEEPRSIKISPDVFVYWIRNGLNQIHFNALQGKPLLISKYNKLC